MVSIFYLLIELLRSIHLTKNDGVPVPYDLKHSGSPVLLEFAKKQQAGDGSSFFELVCKNSQTRPPSGCGDAPSAAYAPRRQALSAYAPQRQAVARPVCRTTLREFANTLLPPARRIKAVSLH